MKAWMYVWESGDITFVCARSRNDAVFILDEIGGADPERLQPLADGFFVSLVRTKKAALQYAGHIRLHFEHADEATEDLLDEALKVRPCDQKKA